MLSALNFGPTDFENSFLSKFDKQIFALKYTLSKDNFDFWLYIGEIPKEVEEIYWVNHIQSDSTEISAYWMYNWRFFIDEFTVENETF